MLTGNGTTDVVMMTNVPTSFLTGAGTVTATITNPTQSANGTNGTVVGFFLCGFKPVGQE